MTLVTFGMFVLTLLGGFVPGFILGAFVMDLIRNLE